MPNLNISLAGGGPAVAESDATGWRLLCAARLHATGVDGDDLPVALRELALAEHELARDAFGIVMNCVDAWEDEYTELHGQDALKFEGWMERPSKRDSVHR